MKRLSWLILIMVAIYSSGTMAALNYTELLARPREPSLHIAYGKEPDQFGELYLPQGKGPFPIIVMIHGGCWLSALPGQELMAYLAQDMRGSGFVVWNIEYRRLGILQTGYPDMFTDVANAVDYVGELAKSYPLDTAHAIVLGHSAGGQLALWAAARASFKQGTRFYTAHAMHFTYALTLAGINDLESYRNTGPNACGGPATIGSLVNSARKNPYADTSPAAMLPLGIEHTIVSGAQDPIVPPQFGDAYAQAAQLAGDPADVILAPGAGHFELIDPASDAWKLIKPRLLAHRK